MDLTPVQPPLHPIPNIKPIVKNSPSELNGRIKSVITEAYSYQKDGRHVLHERLTAKWAFQRLWGDDNRALKKLHQSTDEATSDPKTAQANAKKVVAIIKKGFGDDLNKPELQMLAKKVQDLEKLVAATEPPKKLPKPAKLQKGRVRPHTQPTKTGLLVTGLLLFSAIGSVAALSNAQNSSALDVYATTHGGVLGTYGPHAAAQMWATTRPHIEANSTRSTDTPEAASAPPAQALPPKSITEQIDALQGNDPTPILDLLKGISDPKIRQEGINHIFNKRPRTHIPYQCAKDWELARALILSRQFPETFPTGMVASALWNSDLDVAEILIDKVPITPSCIGELAARFDPGYYGHFTSYQNYHPEATENDYQAHLKKLAPKIFQKYDSQPKPQTEAPKTVAMTADQKYKAFFSQTAKPMTDSELGLRVAKLKGQGIEMQRTTDPIERAFQEEMVEVLKDGVHTTQLAHKSNTVITNQAGKIIGFPRTWHDRMAYEMDHQHFAGVPPTIPLKLPNESTEFVQKWVDNGTISHKLDRNMLDTHQMQAIELLDMRIGNSDRIIGNNVVVATQNDQSLLFPVDHDRAPTGFYQFTNRPNMPQFDQPFTKKCQDYVASLDIEADAKILDKWVAHDPYLSSRPGFKEAVVRGMKMRTTVLKMGIEKGLKVKHFMHLFAMHEKAWHKIVQQLPVQNEASIRQALQAEFDKACQVVTDRVQRVQVSFRAWTSMNPHMADEGGAQDDHLP